MTGINQPTGGNNPVQNTGQGGSQDPAFMSDLDQIIQMIADDLSEHIDQTAKQEKEKKTKQAQAQSGSSLATASNFGVLQSNVQQKSEKLDSFLKNYGPPGLPSLQQGIKSLKQVPSGKTGFGNPWLQGSLMTKIFMVMLKILPIMMEVEFKEAMREAQKILDAQKLSVDAAKAAKESKELEAQKQRLDAIKSFVSAGIALATMASAVAPKSLSGLKNTATKLKPHLQYGASRAGAGLRRAGSWANRNTIGPLKTKLGLGETARTGPGVGFRQPQTPLGRAGAAMKQGYAASGAGAAINQARKFKNKLNRQKELDTERDESQASIREVRTEKENRAAAKQKAEIKREERLHKARETVAERKEKTAAKMQERTMMVNQFSQAAEGMATGGLTLMQADLTLQQGEAEYLQHIYSAMMNVANESKQNAHEANQKAAELFSSLLQQLNQLIQAQQVFSISIRR